MSPSMVAFLEETYGRAKEADKFIMPQQPALKLMWNTMVFHAKKNRFCTNKK